MPPHDASYLSPGAAHFSPMSDPEDSAHRQYAYVLPEHVRPHTAPGMARVSVDLTYGDVEFVGSFQTNAGAQTYSPSSDNAAMDWNYGGLAAKQRWYPSAPTGHLHAPFVQTVVEHGAQLLSSLQFAVDNHSLSSQSIRPPLLSYNSLSTVTSASSSPDEQLGGFTFGTNTPSSEATEAEMWSTHAGVLHAQEWPLDPAIAEIGYLDLGDYAMHDAPHSVNLKRRPSESFAQGSGVFDIPKRTSIGGYSFPRRC